MRGSHPTRSSRLEPRPRLAISARLKSSGRSPRVVARTWFCSKRTPSRTSATCASASASWCADSGGRKRRSWSGWNALRSALPQPMDPNALRIDLRFTQRALTLCLPQRARDEERRGPAHEQRMEKRGDVDAFQRVDAASDRGERQDDVVHYSQKRDAVENTERYPMSRDPFHVTRDEIEQGCGR